MKKMTLIIKGKKKALEKVIPIITATVAASQAKTIEAGQDVKYEIKDIAEDMNGKDAFFKIEITGQDEKMDEVWKGWEGFKAKGMMATLRLQGLKFQKEMFDIKDKVV